MGKRRRHKGWLLLLVLIVLVGTITGTAEKAYAFTAVRNTDEEYIGDITHGVLNDAMKFYGYHVDDFLAGDTGKESWLYSYTQAQGDFRSQYRNDTAPYGLGTERTADGVPDLYTFNKKGQVCASFVTMMYNYLDYKGFSEQTSKLYQKVKNYNTSYAPEDLGLYTYNVRSWNRECEKLVAQGKMTAITDYTKLQYGDIIIFGQSLTGSECAMNAHIAISLGPVNIGGSIYHTMIHHQGEDTGNGAVYSAVELVAGNATPQAVSKSAAINTTYGKDFFTPINPDTKELGMMARSSRLVFRVAYRFTDNPFENQVGGIKVQVKDGQGAAIQNVKFGVYSDSACTKKVSEITTDKNGQAYYGKDSSGAFTLKKGTVYYLKELSVPSDKYQISKEVYTVKIRKDQWSTPDQNETIVYYINRGGLFAKIVNEYGDAVPEVVLGVYSDSACTQYIDSVTTDQEGRAVYGMDPYGNYTLKNGAVYYFKAIHVPENYQLNTAVYKGTVAYGKMMQINNASDIVLKWNAAYNVGDRYYTGLWYSPDTEEWLYVENGSINRNYSGLTCYYGTWYYVEDGILNWYYTGLTCYYGTWYYVEGGVLNWDYSGLTCYYGTWYYVEDGILNWYYTGLTCYYGMWYYVEDGVLNWDYSGLTCYYGTWYYVENGMLNWNYSGLTCYYDTWYYVSGGVLDWNYTGYTNYYGAWYYVDHGVMR